MPNSPIILHLGVGSFHRAHQAIFMQRLLDLNGEEAWQLVGGNIRPDMEATIDALNAQQGQYTVETVSPQGERSYTRVTALSRVIPYESRLRELIEVGADPQTRIVSFTVTEAGYYLDAAGDLDMAHPDIQADLTAIRSAQPTRTIYGVLISILAERRRRNAGPITLLSCDNLRHNGTRFRRGLLQFAESLRETSFEAWILANTTSPNTMVDRITPRPTDELRARVAEMGWDDAAPVMAETYLEWVIEDNFAAGRPAWERVGATIVRSVTPYEEAKIRILNGSHSCIAWAGYLAGHPHIHEAIADARIKQLAYDYVTQDVIPCLQPSPVALESYRDTVFERFGNAHIKDTVERVMADSYAKLRGFIAPTLVDRLSQHEHPQHAALVVALFLKALIAMPSEFMGRVASGPMDLNVFNKLVKSSHPVSLLCNDKMLWGDLAGDERLIAVVQQAFDRLTPASSTRHKATRFP